MPELNLTPREEKEILFKGVFNSPLVTIIGSVLTTFIIAAIFFKLGGPVPISINQTSVEKTSPFNVSGEGSVTIVPDQAKATFGITKSAPSVTDAQKTSNEVINKLKSDLKQIGVEEKDIKTTSYNVYPDYSFDEGRSRITGYNVTTQVQVTFRNFENLNQAFDLATAAGTNLAGQLSFDLSKEARQKAEDEARKAAIEEAKQKAEKIAKEAGIKLGKIINVQESSLSAQPIFRGLAATGIESAQQTEISPGSSEVRVQVTLSFETL